MLDSCFSKKRQEIATAAPTTTTAAATAAECRKYKRMYLCVSQIPLEKKRRRSSVALVFDYLICVRGVENDGHGREVFPSPLYGTRCVLWVGLLYFRIENVDTSIEC